MDRSNRGRISIYLADPVGNVRTSLRGALAAEGFTAVEAFPNLATTRAAVAVRAPDLLIIDSHLVDVPDSEAAPPQPSDGRPTCELIADIRHGRCGANPYIACIATTWRPDEDLVRRITDSGADDLLIKPVSLAQLMERMRALINGRKPFVVTADYIGPDRRKKPRPDAAAAPMIEVPNTLRMKAAGEAADPDAIETAIDAARREVNERKLARDAIQIGFLVRLIVEEQPPGPLAAGARAQVGRLLAMAEDIADRLPGSRFAAAGGIADALLAAARTLVRRGEAATRQDVELLKPLAEAILLGVNEDKDLAGLTDEISTAIAGFRARQQRGAA